MGICPGALRTKEETFSGSDTHVTICPYFTVPVGKMEEFKANFADFYKGTKEGTSGCLYYGFAVSGNKVFCREGYKNGEAVLEHLEDVKAPLDKAIRMVGVGGLRLELMGPKAELDKCREAFDAFHYELESSIMSSLWGAEPNPTVSTVYYELDGGSIMSPLPSDLVVYPEWEGWPDSHVIIMPYFTVPEGKMDDFKKNFDAFYAGVKGGTKDTIYYGFAVSGNQVFCREGYLNAEAVLQHLVDVGEALGKAVEMVGDGGLKLAVMGPKEELEKEAFKARFTELKAEFWTLDKGAIWK